MGIWYATREDVKSALDSLETARNNARIDRAIEAASRNVEGLTHRRFYPWTGTRYKDWPNLLQYARSWRLWLDEDELVSVTSLISGGTTIPSTDYFLEPSNLGPPYNCIEIDLASTASWDSNADTHQRSIAITGVFAGCSVETEPAGALAEALDDSETGVDVTDSSGLGVGDLILVGSEYMRITAKGWLDTAVNIDASDSMTASAADVSILLSTTVGAPTTGEVILINSEKMLVVDVAGSTLTVKRAWDGSVLATHAANADIYAPRSLTVVRGSLGTTAATASASAPVSRYVVPGPVNTLTVAYAMNTLLQQGSGYARVSGSGDNAKEFTGRGIAAAEKDVVRSYGRQLRIGAV